MDGRGCEDYRHMEIETDVVSNTDGSAKVTLVMESVSNRILKNKKMLWNVSSVHAQSSFGPDYCNLFLETMADCSLFYFILFYMFCSLCLFQGHTVVLVGIKTEIGKPRPMVPNEGYLEFFVDW